MSEQQVITSAQAWRGAGGGRGATSGMRLDTDAGQRELAVEQEVQRLAAINPASRERLRALAQFNLSQPAAEPKPVDRETQYMVLGYAPADAAANARFDADLEQRLSARTQKARPDAMTGERIVQRYNPNSERERVASEEKEMHALRADARQRAAAQEMPSVVRGLAQGAGGLYAASMGAAGLAGELTGNEDLRDWGLEGYRETMRGVNNIRLAPTFTGIRSTGDAVEWALENSGYAGFENLFAISQGSRSGLGGMGSKARCATNSSAIGKRRNAADRPKTEGFAEGKRHLPEGLGRNRADELGMLAPRLLAWAPAHAAHPKHPLIPIALQRDPWEIVNRFSGCDHDSFGRHGWPDHQHGGQEGARRSGRHCLEQHGMHCHQGRFLRIDFRTTQESFAMCRP